jgi:hypothetical protein
MVMMDPSCGTGGGATRVAAPPHSRPFDRATVRNGVQERSRAIAIQEVSGRQGSIPGGLLVAGLLPIICLLLVVVPR